MSALLKSLEGGSVICVEATFEQAARSAKLAKVYDCASPQLRALLKGGSLYAHQAKALELIKAGHDLVIATGTASGKTLAFQVPIIEDLSRGQGTYLALYPQKALAADQRKRWSEALALTGHEPALVQEINGDVPSEAREWALQNARILLATPDVIHAWLMRQSSSPTVHAFLKRLRFLVLDEAHALEGAFGSSVAFLLRRLMRLRDSIGPSADLQFIAASATVRDPAAHLQALTGRDFEHISEIENGAPVAGTALAHVVGPAHGRAAEAQLSAILAEAIPHLGGNAFIAFADTRQGVERIARNIGRDDVLPYRSGYEAADRRGIEDALRRGNLKGVVSTSALELGIDIPQFVLGINLGLPQSRKALRQRIGRIGRTQPGLFLLMAPAPTFAQLGTTFEDYVTGAVEPSPLYLENEFIQYAQARCLIEETTSQQSQELGESANWPQTFAGMVERARPGGQRSRELDLLAAAGGDSPHLNYPLRQICERKVALKTYGCAEPIGTISDAQAIREAYPGATYFHLQRAHRVAEWRVNSYERAIYLKPAKAAQPTHPLLRQCVSGSFNAEEVIDGHLLRSEKGAIVEARLQIMESVEGYRTEKGAVNYAFLRRSNPRMRRQAREFSTTGVILQISEPWFAGSRLEQVERRTALGAGLKELLCRHESIATGEIHVAASQIALQVAAGVQKLDDAIAIYDNLHGGLRLTAKLFARLPELAEYLCRAAETAGADAFVDFDTARRFAAWAGSLQPALANHTGTIEVEVGEHLIFAPGSLVTFRKGGTHFERRLLAPELLKFPTGDLLFYRYQCDDDANSWVAHDAVEASGHEWSRVIWNPQTNETRPCQ